MNIKFTNSKQVIYFRFFIALVLSISLTMLILSSILYTKFETIALEQVYSDSLSSIMQTNQNVSSMTNIAVYLSNQVFNDTIVAKLLYFSEPSIYDVNVAINQLYYGLSIPFIDSIYIYNSKANIVYVNAKYINNNLGNRKTIQSADNFDDKDFISIVENYKEYKRYTPIPRSAVITSQGNVKKQYYSLLSYDPFTSNKLDSAVMVNFSEEWLRKVINSDFANNDSETIAINNNGILVCNSKKYSMMDDISNLNYIKSIMEKNDEKGYFIEKIDGQKELVTFIKSDAFAWTYIRTTPWENIIKKINAMRALTIILSLIITVLGLIISFYISKKLYKPIDAIMANVKKLEDENKNNAKELRQNILKNIVMGTDLTNKQQLVEKFVKLQIPLDVDGVFRLILFKVDNYNKFCQRFSSEERNRIRNAVINICSTELSKSLNVYNVDIGEDCFLFLQEVEDETDTSFKTSLRQLQQEVIKQLDISLSIAISSLGYSIESLGETYKLVNEALLHRLFYGLGSIIDTDEIIKLKENEYTYPQHKEKQLMDSLMADKTEKAKEICDEIIDETAEYSFQAVNLAISRLIFSINNIVNTIIKNNSLSQSIDNNLQVLMVQKAETSQELKMVFYEVFDNLHKELENKKNSKHDELIIKINQIIDANYGDYELSLNSIAETLGMTPTYIAILYKKYTLSTVLDKIIQIRMEKARQLLIKTDFSIAEISEKSGFNNSTYFYKVFKKINGVTPSDYRKNSN